MEAFFFGDDTRPLYGVYHPPHGQRDENMAVLVCYPLGREYMRAHAMLVAMCNDLAGMGYHVMRFDYSATGDSAGDDGSASWEDWLDDVQTAVAELKDISGVTRVAGIGLRLGATLLALAASRRETFDRILLWEPVVDGGQHIRTLEALQTQFFSNTNHFPRARLDDLDDDELLGHRVPKELRDAIRQLDLLKIDRPLARLVALYAQTGSPGADALRRYLESGDGTVRSYPVASPVEWDVAQFSNRVSLDGGIECFREFLAAS